MNLNKIFLTLAIFVLGADTIQAQEKKYFEMIPCNEKDNKVATTSLKKDCDGFGVYTKKEITYTGFFKNAQLYFGKYRKNNADYYGYFKDFKLIGYGKIEYKPGDYYWGEITDDKPNGKGFINKDDDKVVYGEFKNGEMTKMLEEYSLKGIYKGYWPFYKHRDNILKNY